MMLVELLSEMSDGNGIELDGVEEFQLCLELGSFGSVFLGPGC